MVYTSAWAGCNAGYQIEYFQKGIFLKNLKVLHNLFFGNVALEKEFVKVQGRVVQSRVKITQG